jgi:hypothetical protein
MNQIRTSRTLVTVAASACRLAGLAGSGSRAWAPRHRRGRGGVVCVFAVVALLAALGGPGVSQSAALAGSAAAPDWTQQAPATSPPARENAATAYDAATRTIVLFGGLVNGVDRSDTWTWDGLTWAQQAPATSPHRRQMAAMAYDAATRTVVLFGGPVTYRDTWTWDGSTWTQQAPATRPPARSLATMAYDPATGTIVLFGGVNYIHGTHLLRDTWTWNGSTWTKQAPATSPPAREGAAMAYDAATGTIVLFGGANGSQGTHFLRDTWTWNGSTWTKQAPATSPSARAGAQVAYDAATGTIVLFGGVDSHGFLSDTWTWAGSTWTRQAPTAHPSARAYGSMAYDAATGNAVLFGGAGHRGTLFSDTWTWGGSG